jgi:hypothetical protein
MAVATVPSIQTTTLGVRLFDRLAISEVAAKTVYVLAVTVLAVGVRAAALSTYGFSEDEINKVRAIDTGTGRGQRVARRREISRFSVGFGAMRHRHASCPSDRHAKEGMTGRRTWLTKRSN